ncbi:hypothetical protein ABRQ03_00955 [Pectobacterium jejuense]|nr:hypothetical protein [Pectobacterium versatile]
MTIRPVKYIQYRHRVGSHNINQNPQQKNGLIFLIVVITTAFSVLSLIL